jgi:hypothetical protein
MVVTLNSLVELEKMKENQREMYALSLDNICLYDYINASFYGLLLVETASLKNRTLDPADSAVLWLYQLLDWKSTFHLGESNLQII